MEIILILRDKAIPRTNLKRKGAPNPVLPSSQAIRPSSSPSVGGHDGSLPCVGRELAKESREPFVGNYCLFDHPYLLLHC